MYNSISDAVGNGGAVLVTVPPYIDKSHIEVAINGVPTLAFSWINASTVSVTAATGAAVRVSRRSSPTTRLVNYSGGRAVPSDTLNLDSLQAFFLAQEAQDAALQAATGSVPGGVVIATDLFSDTGSTQVGRKSKGTGAIKRTLDDKLGESISAEDLGVDGGPAPHDATASLQAAMLAAAAAGYKELRLTNPLGYRLTDQIIQPYNLRVVGDGRTFVHCDEIAPGASGVGRAAWVCEYASWASNADRWAFRKPLSGVIFQGHAAPADNVHTDDLHGVELRSYHQTLEHVCVVGFDKAWSFAQSVTAGGWFSWESNLKECVAAYCKYGLYADFSSAGGGSGAGISWDGGAIAHCDWSIYNAYGEITLVKVASDAPTKGHVKDNLTTLGGNEIGFIHWQNSRIEAGGQVGTPWVNNSGTIRLRDTFVTERNSTDFIFWTNAGGVTIWDGGTSRTSDGRYKAGGAGMFIQRAVRPINDLYGVMTCYENSGVLNGDLASLDTSGWTVTAGTVALTNVADATMLAAGRALNMVASVFPAKVASSKIELDQSCAAFVLTYRGNNANTSAIPVTLKQYNRDNVLVSSQAATIPVGGTTVQGAIKHRRFPNSCYLVIEIGFSTGQTAAVRGSDFYLTQY